MQLFPQTAILRHRRENLKKCSLRGLENRSDLKFLTYPKACINVEEWRGSVILKLDAPILTWEDRHHSLFLIDATWRYSEKMLTFVEDTLPELKARSLPFHFRTAYPRRQEDCRDPERGLASIEALFLSYKILGRETDTLLDYYYWKNEFLEKNKPFLDF